ncbi:MAG: tol-pal system protein YbgF [Maricaulaceae bacterium]|nr:tol-pal system protein YbgF [Maricaulaceae bacterium]
MLRLTLAAALALAIAAPAAAQSRREMVARIDAAEARIAEMERGQQAGGPVIEQLLSRIDALEYQLRDLTGETERLSFENRRLRQQVEALQERLDRRSFDSEDNAGQARPGGPASLSGGDVAVVNPDSPFADDYAAATGVLGGAAAPAETGRRPAAPREAFDRAHTRLMDGDFDGAREMFRAFVTEHGNDPQAGEAYYWLGETYFVRGDYPDAAEAYIASLRERPNGARAPDALVRLGASLAALGRTREACDTLSRFNRQFPNAGDDARARAQRERVRAGCT